MKKITGLFIMFFLLTGATFGQRVWDFSLKDVDNNLLSFNELKGEELTLLDFWTTWCKPCKKSIPELNKIFASYQNKGVQVIGINCDGPRSVAKVGPFIRSLNVSYPILIDISSDLMNTLNLAYFPTLIMVNSTGEIEYVHEGYVKGDEELIKSEIDKRLSE